MNIPYDERLKLVILSFPVLLKAVKESVNRQVVNEFDKKLNSAWFTIRSRK